MSVEIAFLLAASAVVQPLSPVGKWNVEFADAMCVARREYGTPQAPVTLFLKSLPAGGSLEIIVAGGPGRGSKGGETKVALAPSGQIYPAGYYEGFAPKLKRQLARYFAREIPLEALDAATVISLNQGQARERQFALTDMAQLGKVVRACHDDLLRTWNLDPAQFAGIVTRPQLIFGSVSDLDYPDGARRKGEEGRVMMRWTIDTKGRPIECAVISSSGSPKLDSAACRLVEARFRYKPARDKDGTPVMALGTAAIHWHLPSP